MKIKIKKIYPDAKMPSYALPGDVGLDIFSREETCTLQPGERKNFFCGFALEFPIGYAAIIKDKSGMANKGLHALGGVYDSGYRGEYNVILVNLNNEPHTIEKGQKLAQLIIFPVAIGELEEVDELSESERGDGKFGSTGKF